MARHSAATLSSRMRMGVVVSRLLLLFLSEDTKPVTFGDNVVGVVVEQVEGELSRDVSLWVAIRFNTQCRGGPTPCCLARRTAGEAGRHCVA